MGYWRHRLPRGRFIEPIGGEIRLAAKNKPDERPQPAGLAVT